MAKSNNKTDLRKLAKELGTKIIKTKFGSETVKLRTPTIKGIFYDDGSGGLSFKVPGLDCFSDNGSVLEQLENLEKTMNAYIALKPDLKKLKRAIKRSEKIPPTRKPAHAQRISKKSS